MSIESEIAERAMAARWLILEAGRLTWDYFEKGVATETKADFTPVTIADREAEQLLRGGLAQRFPDDGFLGEEFGTKEGSSGFCWIIDPIDATMNFVRGIPLFGNLVGLRYGEEMAAGLCYVPGLKDLYHAIRGQGAYRNDRRIQVSTIDQLDKAQIIYSSLNFFQASQTTEAFVNLVMRAGRSRGFGDFYGYLLVATGAAEAMVDPGVSIWDIAALQPIIEEAGGVFTDLTGKRRLDAGHCVVGNQAIHPQVIEALGYIS